MTPNLRAFAILAAMLALSGQPPKKVDASPAPVVIDRSAEVAALQAEVEQLRAELAQAKSVERPTPVVQPVSVSAPARAVPVAYYQRRAVYGPLGRFRGYEDVPVTSQSYQKSYSQSSCAGGNCSTGRRGLFGRR